MIGYYVHHHGGGHLTTATAVADGSDEPVVALSSLPEPDAHPFADWVTLPPDPALERPLDPTAGGALHWAPLDSAPYAARMHRIAAWIDSQQPRIVVVDVSVEIAALVRLLGVPLAVVALPGTRDDRAHRLAHELATVILAPWPQAVYDPPHLRAVADKVCYTGAFSRFDDRTDVCAPTPSHALVLLGSGGTDIDAATVDELERVTGWCCRGVGGPGLRHSADVWADLQHAQLVVTSAGLATVAEVAAAGRPAVLVPQPRPFGEQHATAHALEGAGIATVATSWPAPGEWPAIIEAALAKGGDRWGRWNDGAGVRRAVAALARAA